VQAALLVRVAGGAGDPVWLRSVGGWVDGSCCAPARAVYTDTPVSVGAFLSSMACAGSSGS
jgi:hypothetical protein